MVNWKQNEHQYREDKNHYLLRVKGYNVSFVRKQQAYNYTLTRQISTKYRIKSLYFV